MRGFFQRNGGIEPPDHTIVLWLPFYHDLGLIMGVCTPILSGCSAVLTSPVSFLQRPARWMQMVASYPSASTGAPNFAFELATRKTSDEDMAGYDLSNVSTIISGAERVLPETIKRFSERFKRFNLRESVIRPTYGLAESTLYVATTTENQPPAIVDFETDKLAEGQAQRCASGTGTALVSYSALDAPTVRIVDPDTQIECAPGSTGEIWVHGDNVGLGYWQNPGRDRAHLRRQDCRAVGRHTRRALVADRGFGLPIRWRAVHRRPHQGSVDRVRAQPRPRRHRGDDLGDN